MKGIPPKLKLTRSQVKLTWKGEQRKIDVVNLCIFTFK